MEPPAPDRPPVSSLTQRELVYRLGSFTNIRWVMAGMALALLVGSWRLLGVEFLVAGRSQVPWALATIAAIFLYNVVFLERYRKLTRRREPSVRSVQIQALGQIGCDLLAVCVLVHFTGGVENFFLLLVLLPVVIATELLSRPLAMIVAAGAAAGVNMLVWGEQSGLLRHVELVWPGEKSHPVIHADWHYVLVYSLAVTLTIFIVAAIASSITARLRRRERQLEDAYDMLRRSDENKSFFMRKAGHEMRAPLAAIFSILDALGVRSQLGPEHARLIDRGRQRLRALMSMVDDLRRYSRLRAREQVLSPASVNLAEIVSATSDLFRQQASDAGVELSCHAEPAEIFVRGDEELLGELVTNLIANAVQYTPSGGQIEVTLSRGEIQAILSVSDTGIGLSPQAREHLFEEFYRAPEAKQAFPSGTGLGLAICRRIVEMHSGSIEARAREGGGTVFEVTLPLKEVERGA